MTQGATEGVVPAASTQQVLDMVASTVDTLSALLGLSAYIDPGRRRPCPPQLPQYTLDDVSDHCWADDCWVIIYDRVYDITKFLRSHPGGEEILMENAGRDATLAFRGVGHSEDAIDVMQPYQVGVLVPEQCMWSA